MCCVYKPTEFPVSCRGPFLVSGTIAITIWNTAPAHQLKKLADGRTAKKEQGSVIILGVADCPAPRFHLQCGCRSPYNQTPYPQVHPKSRSHTDHTLDKRSVRIERPHRDCSLPKTRNALRLSKLRPPLDALNPKYRLQSAECS